MSDPHCSFIVRGRARPQGSKRLLGKALVESSCAELVIVNHQLSASQARNLELKLKVRVIDKTELNSPFLLEKNDPKYIAEFLDRIVLEKELREDLAIDGYEFARKIADPDCSDLGCYFFFRNID